MSRFNIRCYGIIINENNEILLSDENRFGRSFTKFIGGGLEFGEGTKECLKREILEETGLHSEIGELFYVNDFFQESSFSKEDQIISFYYFVEKIDYDKIAITDTSTLEKGDGEKFRWKSISSLTENDVTFPIDKVVVERIKEASRISHLDRLDDRCSTSSMTEMTDDR